MSNGTDLEPLDLELLGKPHGHGLVPLRMNPATERIRPPRRLFWQRAIKKKTPEAVPHSKRFEGAWNLDAPLFALSRHKNDQWTLRDALSGLVIFGNNGSGKSSSSGRIVLKSFMRSGMGMLLPCAKRDDADKYRRLAKECGREGDVMVFSTENDLCFNFLRYAAETKGVQLETLVHLLREIGDETKSSSDRTADFFKKAAARFFRQSITLLKSAGEPVDVLNLSRIVTSFPRTPEERKSKQWQSSSYLFHLFAKAEARATEQSLLDSLEHYWLEHIAGMVSIQRDGIEGNASNLLDPLTKDSIRHLFCGQTNVTPDHLFEGKIIILDVPVREHFEAAKLCGRIWILMTQRAIERRQVKFDPKNPALSLSRPAAIFVDECQNYANGEPDVMFQATCRSQLCPTVHIVQNYPLFRVAYGSKEMADAFLENKVTKFAHANDGETVDYFVKLIGKTIQPRRSISGKGNDVSESVSESDGDDCPPWEFTSLLRGGPPHFTSEAIVFQSGRTWMGNPTIRWIKRKFSQL
jgi:hypothetical protein